MSYKCVIIDDEPLAVALLTDYIGRTADLELVGAFTSPIDGMRFIQANPCDVVYLDVEMPEFKGIQLMKLFPETISVVLTTAYPQFAVDGFDNNAIDYLLKPISYERFSKSIEKLHVRQSQPAADADFIFIKSGFEIIKVPFESILWLEGMRDYVAIHTTDGKRIMTLQTLKQFETDLPAALFCRVHKSYMVSLSKIERVDRNTVYIGEKPISVSDTYRKSFLELLGR
ncbi:MAG: LytTR family DNA-binding domain-containing protein [Flavobacteriales bacterium]|nr:LytTR family DNA-binding domain-containing protein [Flavobacteriales bacterium]